MEINLSKLKQAMIGQVDKNNVISNNLANINTTGFKKDVLFFETLADEMSDKDGAKHTVDLAQGHLKNTSNPLDLAISGKGFFTVETENGFGYTRDGHFKMDADGVLRSSAGNPVLGENGWIALMYDGMNPKEITVTREGEIFVNGEFFDRLKLTDFESISELKKTGNNLFIAKDEAFPLEVENPEVCQGFLEDSNVSPVQEMIELIEVQRQFESIQRMVRSMDEVFKSAVNQVGQYR